MIQKVFVPVRATERLPEAGKCVHWIYGDQLYVGEKNYHGISLNGIREVWSYDNLYWLEEREIELYEDTKSTIGSIH